MPSEFWGGFWLFVERYGILAVVCVGLGIALWLELQRNAALDKTHAQAEADRRIQQAEDEAAHKIELKRRETEWLAEIVRIKQERDEALVKKAADYAAETRVSMEQMRLLMDTTMTGLNRSTEVLQGLKATIEQWPNWASLSKEISDLRTAVERRRSGDGRAQDPGR